jgi:hypothetical protein
MLGKHPFWKIRIIFSIIRTKDGVLFYDLKNKTQNLVPSFIYVWNQNWTKTKIQVFEKNVIGIKNNLRLNVDFSSAYFSKSNLEIHL